MSECCMSIAVADPGFPIGGHQPIGGAPTSNAYTFWQKQKKLILLGGHMPVAPPWSHQCIGMSVLEKRAIVKCVLTATLLGLCRYFFKLMFLSFNFFVCSLHHPLAPFLHGPSLKIGIGSSGKVFHGSEETT